MRIIAVIANLARDLANYIDPAGDDRRNFGCAIEQLKTLQMEASDRVNFDAAAFALWDNRDTPVEVFRNNCLAMQRQAWRSARVQCTNSLLSIYRHLYGEEYNG